MISARQIVTADHTARQWGGPVAAFVMEGSWLAAHGAEQDDLFVKKGLGERLIT
jgi:hypothetical protein